MNTLKKKLQLGAILCFAFVLVACKKPESAKEATNVLVNGLIYNKEPQKINQLFTYSPPLTEKEETNLVTELKDSFGLDSSYDEQLKAITNNQTKNLMNKTSFKTKVLKEDKGKATIKLSITGLDELDDNKLTQVLETELQKKITDISDETTDEQVTQLVNEISVNTLAMMVADQTVKSEPTIVTLKLMIDSADKGKWVIQNEETFITQLFDAFGQ